MEKFFNTGGISVSTIVSLSPENYDRIDSCARDLDLSFDAVLMAVVNTSVRRHFESAVFSSEDNISESLEENGDA